MLRGQLLSDSWFSATDFPKTPWKDAGLVTLQHAVRRKWNQHTTEVKMQTKKVVRRQLPMTAAYAFTDMGLPSTGPDNTLCHGRHSNTTQGRAVAVQRSTFNLCMALSRSSGRDTIRILRDFDDELFLQAYLAPVLDKDDRLEAMDSVTKAWWTEMTTARGAVMPESVQSSQDDVDM